MLGGGRRVFGREGGGGTAALVLPASTRAGLFGANCVCGVWELGWVVLCWAALRCAALGLARLGSAGLNWAGLARAALSWVEWGEARLGGGACVCCRPRPWPRRCPTRDQPATPRQRPHWKGTRGGGARRVCAAPRAWPARAGRAARPEPPASPAARTRWYPPVAAAAGPSLQGWCLPVVRHPKTCSPLAAVALPATSPAFLSSVRQ